MLDANSLAALSSLKSTIVESKIVYTGTAKGSQGRFGFIKCEQNGEDFFVPPAEMDKILPGDRVEFESTTDNKGKTFAVVTRVIQTDLKQFVGQYQIKGNAHLVAPEDSLISRQFFIAPKDRKGSNQDYVVAQVTRHPFPDGKAQAKITKIIGNKGSAFLEHALTKTRFGLEDEFPLAVSSQASAYKEDFIAQQLPKRADLSSVPFVTIDGASTKDMDDALWATANEQGYQLMVAIADPAAWIAPATAVDKEALHRATSTYLPGQTHHMLPARLAHNLCSLVPGFQRLAIVLNIQLTHEGDVSDFGIEAAVIKSQAKLAYDTVNTFIDQPSAKLGLSADVIGSLTVLNTIATLLRTQRAKHHILMPDRDDFRYTLDDMGKIMTITIDPRSPSRNLVEECMLLANRLGAQFLAQHQTGVFATQAGLRKERVEDIQSVLAEDAPELAHLDPTQLADFVTLVNQCEQQHPALFLLLLKSLTRTEMKNVAAPHFAQGFEAYATITSPIRRYADLANHRVLHKILAGDENLALDEAWVSGLQQRILQSRQAGNAVEQWLKCLYMDNFQDVEYEGVVHYINGMGFGVQLPHNGVDGFVNLKGLTPKSQFDSKRLQHQIGDTTVSLGMVVRVVAQGADMGRKQVQFQWLDHPSNNSPAAA